MLEVFKLENFSVAYSRKEKENELEIEGETFQRIQQRRHS